MSCYGADASVPGKKTPVGVASAASLAGTSVVVPLSASADRVVLQEDLSHGQQIRSFTISDVNGATLYNGTSLGHKHIALLKQSTTGHQITVDISGSPEGGGRLGRGDAALKLKRVAAYSGDGC